MLPVCVKCNQMLKLGNHIHIFDLMILYSPFKMWGEHRTLPCVAKTRVFWTGGITSPTHNIYTNIMTTANTSMHF